MAIFIRKLVIKNNERLTAEVHTKNTGGTTYTFRSDVYDSYVSAVGIDNADRSLFWRGLMSFAISNGLVFNPEEMRGYQKDCGRSVISTIRNNKKGAYEFIYMQSEGAPINNKLPQA